MKIRVGKLRVEASTFMRHMWIVVRSMMREGSSNLKDTAEAMKTKLLVLGFIKNRNLLGAVTNKLNYHKSQLSGKFKLGNNSHHGQKHNDNDNNNKEIVEFCGQQDDNVYVESPNFSPSLTPTITPGISPCLSFKSHGTPDVSIKSDQDIDKIASAFIKGFHNKLKMQKQDSYKTFQAMLERSV